MFADKQPASSLRTLKYRQYRWWHLQSYRIFNSLRINIATICFFLRDRALEFNHTARWLWSDDKRRNMEEQFLRQFHVEFSTLEARKVNIRSQGRSSLFDQLLDLDRCYSIFLLHYFFFSPSLTYLLLNFYYIIGIQDASSWNCSSRSSSSRCKFHGQ